MRLCDYGCGQEGKHQLKNGKWCCSKSYNSCPIARKINSAKVKEVWKDPDSVFNTISYRNKKSNNMKKAHQDPNSAFNSVSFKENRVKVIKDLWDNPNSIFYSKIYRKKISNGVKEAWKDPDNNLNLISKETRSNNMKKLRKDPNSTYNLKSYRENLGKLLKLSIEKINKKYPFFSKIEEMRYNLDKPDEKEIQVHCKNHECENSKEKDGWFTPTYIQLFERIRQLESSNGNGGSYLCCSQHCKDTCILFGLRNDPFKDNNLPYTYQEKQIYNKIVLDRENGLCEYCGEPAEHVHHIFPQKLEPFFALDPDYGVACCAKHHYKYGHQGECNTGNLSKIVCSVESQKFLNQK